MRTAPAAASAAPISELAVYKDQLAEIEAERAQGLIAGSDAEGARVEVARRLIRRAEERERADAAKGAQRLGPQQRGDVGRLGAACRCYCLYLAFGSPGLPGRPYAARLNAPLEQASAADLVAKVEAHLRQHPDDGRGWDVLAPVYMRMGDFQQAADAFEQAHAAAWASCRSGLRALRAPRSCCGNGVVDEPARKAYENLRALEPEGDRAAGVAGDRQGAGRRLARCRRRLQGASPRQDPSEPWSSLLDERMKSVNAKLAETPAVGVPRRVEAQDAAPAPQAMRTSTP